MVFRFKRNMLLVGSRWFTAWQCLILFAIPLGLIFLSYMIVEQQLNRPFVLPWPGRQSIPGIQYARGELQSDFFAQSVPHSVYEIGVQILNWILPTNQRSFLASFITSNYLLALLVYILSAYLIVKMTRYFVKTTEPTYALAYQKFAPILFLVMCVFLFYLPRNELQTGILSYIAPPSLALWQLPLGKSLNPSGMSFLLLLPVLIFSYYWTPDEFQKIKVRNKAFILTLIFSLFIIVSFIHPVNAFFVIAVLGISWLIEPNRWSLQTHSFTRLISMLIVWVTICIAILLIFPQQSIDKNIFYQIYVKIRHPHHYLLSFYLFYKDSLIRMISSFSIVGILCIFILGLKSKMIKIYFYSLIFVVFINLTQYFLVEKLKLSPFISLGIIRAYPLVSLYIGVFLCFFILKLFSPTVNEGNKAQNSMLFLSINAIIILAILSVNIYWLSDIYKKSYDGIARRHELLIREAYKANNINPLELIPFSYQKLPYLREVGGFSVYSDEYFPFSIDYIEEWNIRNQRNKKILKCISDKKDFKICKQEINDINKSFDYISDIPILNGVLLFQVTADKKFYYAYRVDNMK